MTQTKTRIKKAFTQFRGMQVLDGGGKEIPETMYVYFKDAIEDNLPPQIPIEAVEKLRDKYKERDKQEVTVEAGEVLIDLDDLLPKQENATN